MNDTFYPIQMRWYRYRQHGNLNQVNIGFTRHHYYELPLLHFCYKAKPIPDYAELMRNRFQNYLPSWKADFFICSPEQKKWTVTPILTSRDLITYLLISWKGFISLCNTMILFWGQTTLLNIISADWSFHKKKPGYVEDILETPNEKRVQRIRPTKIITNLVTYSSLTIEDESQKKKEQKKSWDIKELNMLIILVISHVRTCHTDYNIGMNIRKIKKKMG